MPYIEIVSVYFAQGNISEKDTLVSFIRQHTFIKQESGCFCEHKDLTDLNYCRRYEVVPHRVGTEGFEDRRE